jgi:D-alanyl-D-alanine carboxypeptidase
VRPIYRTALSIVLTVAVVLSILGETKAASLVSHSNNNSFLADLVSSNSLPNPVDDNLARELQTSLDQSLDDIPGAIFGIISPKGTWIGTSGFSNLATKTPLVVEDRFQIGSITKMFVATTVLQLVEEKTLTLEDTLNKWLPSETVSKIPNYQEITIRQLLNHTSGIYDYTDSLFAQAQTNPTFLLREWSPEQLVAFTYTQKPYFAPGESWQYSNTNVILLGLIVETATHSNIASEIRSRILEPLKLKDTFFAEEEDIPGGYVKGYWDFDQNGTLDDVSFVNLSWAWAAGAMVSNAPDLTRFLAALLSGQLLSSESLDQMLTFVKPIVSDNYNAYGLGIGSLESPGRLWYGHRGLTLAYRSNIFYSPIEDIIYVELVNARDLDNISSPIFATYRAALQQDRSTSVPQPRVISALVAICIALFWCNRNNQFIRNSSFRIRR